MDIASILIHCESDKIYKFMLDRQKINLWSFGIHWDVQEGDEIMKGISNFDQSISFLKITKNDKLKQINYWIGKDIDNLIPRINVRIMLTDDINKNQLLMISLKTNDMDSERWNKLKELHNLEVKKIKEFIENLIP